jgi:uncharacterized protein
MATAVADYKTEFRDGMAIDWDVPITMEDGLVLRGDVYRPVKPGKYPVILTYGPYAKWLHFEQIYKTCWDKMCAEHPDVPANSTNKYQNWEVVDPEKWVPDDYICVRVDSRGCGLRVRHKISRSASIGPVCRVGRTAKSA